jgi:hypothetical protein
LTLSSFDVVEKYLDCRDADVAEKGKGKNKMVTKVCPNGFDGWLDGDYGTGIGTLCYAVGAASCS